MGASKIIVALEDAGALKLDPPREIDPRAIIAGQLPRPAQGRITDGADAIMQALEKHGFKIVLQKPAEQIFKSAREVLANTQVFTSPEHELRDYSGWTIGPCGADTILKNLAADGFAIEWHGRCA